MKITLAPIPFYWSKSQIHDFYQQAATWPIDTLCLGETICSKRNELSTRDWLALADSLKDSGKRIVISTLALVSAESELKTVKALCAQTNIDVEANDLSAVNFLFENGRSFSGGPYLNIYNTQTLKRLHQDGMSRWTLPVELGEKELTDFPTTIQQEHLAIETEVMVHGHLPLALSARCFTARALDRPKDQCKKACLEFPNGLPVSSQEDQSLFTLNGIQTLSGSILDLLPEIPSMISLGVDSIRIAPSQFNMESIIKAYANAIQGQPLKKATGAVAPNLACNGYWHGESGFLRCD